MLSRVFFLSLAVILNTIHFFIPAQVINYSFDPILGGLSFLLFLIIVGFTSNFKKDILFLALILISFLSQLTSFFVNGGVPDYINLYFFNSNIPDLFITLTLLTWWYYRVYKLSKINPAEVNSDV
jgi:hypothetical protein